MNTKDKVEMEKNKELISKEDVKDTPFTIISMNDENVHFAVLGEYRITEKYDNKEKVKKEVQKVNWNRIIQVQMILIEKMKEKELIENLTIKK